MFFMCSEAARTTGRSHKTASAFLTLGTTGQPWAAAASQRADKRPRRRLTPPPDGERVDWSRLAPSRLCVLVLSPSVK